MTNRFCQSFEDLFCDGGNIWDRNRLLAKGLLKWSVIGWGRGGGDAVSVQDMKDGTHLLMATNPTSVKIPCVYISRKKTRPFRED